MEKNPHIAQAETFLVLVEQGDADAAEEFLHSSYLLYFGCIQSPILTVLSVDVDGREPVDVNARKRSTGQSALHLAAFNNE
jgi:hypothetical protein